MENSAPIFFSHLNLFLTTCLLLLIWPQAIYYSAVLSLAQFSIQWRPMVKYRRCRKAPGFPSPDGNIFFPACLRRPVCTAVGSTLSDDTGIQAQDVDTLCFSESYVYIVTQSFLSITISFLCVKSTWIALTWHDTLTWLTLRVFNLETLKQIYLRKNDIFMKLNLEHQ